eukprot:4048755-Prymnesium_polylepis.1
MPRSTATYSRAQSTRLCATSTCGARPSTLSGLEPWLLDSHPLNPTIRVSDPCATAARRSTATCGRACGYSRTTRARSTARATSGPTPISARTTSSRSANPSGGTRRSRATTARTRRATATSTTSWTSAVAPRRVGRIGWSRKRPDFLRASTACANCTQLAACANCTRLARVPRVAQPRGGRGYVHEDGGSVSGGPAEMAMAVRHRCVPRSGQHSVPGGARRAGEARSGRRGARVQALKRVEWCEARTPRPSPASRLAAHAHAMACVKQRPCGTMTARTHAGACPTEAD